MLTRPRFAARGLALAALFSFANGTLPDAVGAQVQAVDEAYTALIREATTEDFFSTPHVDHLPASATVPTPLDHFGVIAGAPDVLHYPEEVYGYMRAVAAASPRVEVFSIGGTEEGREMILVAVGSEESMAELEANKAALRRLADPRVTTPEQAEEIIQTTKPIYWSTGAIHAPETGAPEMFMELIYRLAVSEDPFIQEIRDGLVFINTPVVEADGRAKVVDLHMGKRKDPDLNLPLRPLYWGKYVAHDNNRDNIGLALALSRNVVNTFIEWHPTVFHDHHESASHLYTSTGRGPYNAWLDPIVINEWNRLAYKEVKDMTALGVPGVYTHNFYDGWGANYMMWVAHMRNSVGRFYETQGAGDASTRVITTRAEREWHRPSTPVKEVVWSIRNNVNLQQSALLIALNEVANNGEEFLRNFYLKSQRSIAKATQEGPAAYVLPSDDTRLGQQARLVRLLQDHQFEIHRATEDFEIGEQSFPEGSYVVRMDQPYSRGADMLLDRQYYNPNDPAPYDDVGWTLGPLFNVTTHRIEDAAVLEVSMDPVEARATEGGGVEGRGEDFLIAYNADNELTAFRFAHAELSIEALREAVTRDDRTFSPGSFLIRAADNPGVDLRTLLDEAGAEYGFTAHGVREAVEATTTSVGTPRIAVMHTWVSTQDEGWLRFGLDEYGVPYDYISVHDVRDETDLRSRYDVILFGRARGDALSMVRGLTGDDPMPWKATEVTPNIGRQSSTDDMRGGLGLDGVLNLQRFVEQGGVFVTLAASSQLPIHFGLAEGVSIKATPDLWARGGVFKVDRAAEDSPIAFGYDESLGVAFNTMPVFQMGGGSGFFGFGGGANEDLGRDGSTTARRSGRGGVADEDIVQGRPRNLGEEGVQAFREAQEDDDDDAPVRRPNAGNTVVFRYASDVDELLISGGLRNGDQMTGTPALIDVKRGDGHVIMFSFNPFWRGHTHGSYGLVFNTLLHHASLDATPPAVAEEDGSDPRR